MEKEKGPKEKEKRPKRFYYSSFRILSVFSLDSLQVQLLMSEYYLMLVFFFFGVQVELS